MTDDTPKRHVLHWPAEGVEHGELSGEVSSTDSTARTLATVGGVTVQFVQLLTVGAVSVVGYSWLRAAGVVTGGTALAGLTLTAAVLVVVDVALSRVVVSPTRLVSAVVAVLFVFPLVVAATLLDGDRSLPSTVTRRILDAHGNLLEAFLA